MALRGLEDHKIHAKIAKNSEFSLKNGPICTVLVNAVNKQLTTIKNALD